MKTLQFLKDFISQNPFEQFSLCLTIKKHIQEASKNHNGWLAFLYFLENTQYGQIRYGFSKNFHPENIRKIIINLVGVDDFDKFLEWIEVQKNTNWPYILDSLRPSITLDETKLIGMPTREMLNKIKEANTLEVGYKDHQLDSVSLVPTRLQLLKIVETYNKLYLRPVPDGRDCDDYSFRLRSWLSSQSQALGNLSIPYAEFRCYDENGTYKFYHAICAALVHKDGVFSAVNLEPQSKEIWDAGDVMPWYNGEKEIRLKYLMA